MTKPPTTAPQPVTPERRMELLREIQGGAHSLRGHSSRDAQAAVEAKLVEWRELDQRQDIRLRTIHEIAPAGERLRLAVAILTVSGVTFLENHAGQSGTPPKTDEPGERLMRPPRASHPDRVPLKATVPAVVRPSAPTSHDTADTAVGHILGRG